MARKLKPILLCLALLFCALFLGGWGGYDGGAKQKLTDLDVSAQLTPDGSLHMSERWTVDLLDRGRAYRNVYKTFRLDPDKYDGIDSLAVYDEDSKREYKLVGELDPTADSTSTDVCYYHRTGDTLEIGLMMPPISEGVRTFTISYTFKNCVTVYDDVSVLYAQLIGSEFSLPISRMNCVITLPDGAQKEDLQAWLHTTAKSDLSIDTANKISFRAQEIPAETMVETRITMPKALFPSSSRVKSGTVLAGIVQEEQKWADESDAARDREYMIGILDAGGGALLLLASIVFIVLSRKKRRPYPVEAPEYTRDIPPDNSPAGAATLFYHYQRGITEKNRGRVFSATLLSLAHKGYVRFQQTDDGKNFAVALTVKGQKENITDLTKSERVFLRLVSAVAHKHDGMFTMKDFKKYGEKHFNFIDRTVEEFLTAAKAETADRGYYEKTPAMLTAGRILASILFVIGLLLLFLSGFRLLYLPAMMVVCPLLYLLLTSGVNRLSKKGEYDYRVWLGLKKFLLEFSRMTEYGVPELVLWEEYLVYATMMGISKQVCEQLKVVYPQMREGEYLDTYWGNSYLYFMLGSHYGSFGGPGGDFGSALGNTLNTISQSATRLAHPPASNSGGGGFGGGGFSGGGGGFGGGGGGVR